MMKMKVKTVAMLDGGSFSVLLSDEEEKKVLPIVVGPFEAQAIALYLQGQSLPRPLTHELTFNILQEVGYHISKIVVTDIREEVFYAEIYLQNNNKELIIDARPSDAIALAVRSQAPIFMTTKMVEFTYDYDDMAFLEEETD